jgi:hypothetical protein
MTLVCEVSQSLTDCLMMLIEDVWIPMEWTIGSLKDYISFSGRLVELPSDRDVYKRIIRDRDRIGNPTNI